MRHHDLLIIGTGSGNSLITPELEGLDIAIVEKGAFGGTCLNVGCIPTKMFVRPAELISEAASAERLNLHFDAPSIDWPAMRDRIFGRIDPIAEGGERYRRSQEFVTVYTATARFVAERTVLLSTGEKVSADRVVVAAGSRPQGYPIDGLRTPDPDRGLHTSDTVMRLDELPARMVILGGGFVGCEFAHVFSAFGVQVTQVQRSELLLRGHERAISQAYTDAARAQYPVLTSTLVTSATFADGVWSLTTAGPQGVQTLEAEVVLLATGRQPNGDQLAAPLGGMTVEPDGRIQVDEQQRTTAPGTWALGDVSTAWPLKHVANHEARVVAHNLAVDLGRLPGPPIDSDHRFVPHAVFGHPQVAGFGPTRENLEASGLPFVAKTQMYGDTAYGWALEDTTSFLTVYAHPKTGTVLAAHCIGPFAASLIQPLMQAASFGQHAHQVARGQYWIHPALSEVVENALLGLDLSAPH